MKAEDQMGWPRKCTHKQARKFTSVLWGHFSSAVSAAFFSRIRLWQFLAISADSEAGGEKDKRVLYVNPLCVPRLRVGGEGGHHIAQVTLAQGSKQHFKM